MSTELVIKDAPLIGPKEKRREMGNMDRIGIRDRDGEKSYWREMGPSQRGEVRQKEQERPVSLSVQQSSLGSSPCPTTPHVLARVNLVKGTSILLAVQNGSRDG